MAERPVIEEQRARVAAYVELLPDIAAIQAHGQHVFVAACISALARLRVADHIDGKSRVGEIATRAGVDAFALRRLLNFLEPHGFVELGDDRAALTGKGRLLRSDSLLWSSLALCGANDAAWHLTHSLRTGEAAFPQAFGCDFWSFLAARPDQQQAFADAMRLQAAMLAVACLPLIDTAGLETIADIGGGTGDLLATLLEANPALHGILVDQPAMLAQAHPALRSGPLAPRCSLLAGDLFGPPPRADAYLLAQVLHDWDDERAARILANIRSAAREGVRLFVLTAVLPDGGEPHPAKTADVGMLALFGGGRERTEADLRRLLSQSGWTVNTIAPTRVASVITATGASGRDASTVL